MVSIPHQIEYVKPIFWLAANSGGLKLNEKFTYNIPDLRAETAPIKQATLYQTLRRAGTYLSGARNDRMGNGFLSLNRILGFNYWLVLPAVWWYKFYGEPNKIQ
jgi:hypothetical protein